MKSNVPARDKPEQKTSKRIYVLDFASLEVIYLI